jgi:hypothetical protein
MKRSLAAIAALLATLGSAAAQQACKGSPDVLACHAYEDAAVFVRSVDGIFAFQTQYSADRPWWPIGGPSAMPAQMFYDLRLNPTVVLHGNFEVCFQRSPVKPEPVCIESATNVVARIPQYD